MVFLWESSPETNRRLIVQNPGAQTGGSAHPSKKGQGEGSRNLEQVAVWRVLLPLRCGLGGLPLEEVGWEKACGPALATAPLPPKQKKPEVRKSVDAAPQVSLPPCREREENKTHPAIRYGVEVA